MTDWVANYQIIDYFCHISDKMVNSQVFFFRQVAYDHPKEIAKLTYEEAERVK